MCVWRCALLCCCYEFWGNSERDHAVFLLLFFFFYGLIKFNCVKRGKLSGALAPEAELSANILIY